MLAMVTDCTQIFACYPSSQHGTSALAVTNLCIVGCLLDSILYST